MKVPPIRAIIPALISLCLSACNEPTEQVRQQPHKITAIAPQVKAVTVTQQYVCQIQAHRHVKIRALEKGYLEEILVKKGQVVKEGDLLFKVVPAHYQAKRDLALAEAKLAELESEKLKEDIKNKVVSEKEVALHEAKLANAKAKAALATDKLSLPNIYAPFDGVVDGLNHLQGSLVKEGEILATLSENSVMRAYFNVPEVGYLEYMADRKQQPEALPVELMLGSNKKFNQVGKIAAIHSNFDHETGTITFRADFPNPDRLLRHGQTGAVLISRVVKNATVIPQRATFELLHKRYVYVVDKNDVVHRREIVIQNEFEHDFVVKSGIGVNDKIVLDGIRQLHDGEKVEYEAQQPEQLSSKYKAE
jgi:membrane fusion protein (multidrug efflux system)